MLINIFLTGIMQTNIEIPNLGEENTIVFHESDCNGESQDNIPNYSVALAVFTTFFCFWPIGVGALVNSLRVC